MEAALVEKLDGRGVADLDTDDAEDTGLVLGLMLAAMAGGSMEGAGGGSDSSLPAHTQQPGPGQSGEQRTVRTCLKAGQWWLHGKATHTPCMRTIEAPAA